MKRRITLIIIFLLLLENLSRSSVPTTSIRVKTLFNNDWKFISGDNTEFKNPEYDEAAWRNLNLPHDWSIEGSIDKSIGGEGGFFPAGIGWYRKSFVLPDSLKGKKIVIQFDGVYMNSEVWINGNFLGRYPYGYSTFQYDITLYLKSGAGEQNVLAVRVDNSLYPSTRWYNGSGIYRNVWLIATNFVHFHNYKGVFITTPEISDQRATISINYNFAVHFFSQNDFPGGKIRSWRADEFKPTSKKLKVRSVVFNNKGIEVSSTESEKDYLNLRPENYLTQQLEIEKPVLWSIGTPVLYYLRSEILSDGKVIDDQITPFGIRKLEFIPGKGMFVNGKPDKLKGVCLHHDAGSFGAAVPIEVWRYRLLKLKGMGCNAVRTSHNPAAPEFYDLCDSLGFYVLDEAFDEWTRDWDYNFTDNPRGKAKYGYHLYFNQWHETDLSAMVLRDRNHPSVVMYSIGNEIPDQKNPNEGKLASELVAICHSEDPTRPVTAGTNAEMIAGNNGYIDAQDISGYNYIERIAKDKMYQAEYEKRPDKLCLGTETGFSVRDFIAYRDFDFVLGQFIWTGIDYLGEARRYPVRGFYAGIIDIAGNELPSYYLNKSMWTNEPTVRIAVSPKGKSAVEWNHRACDSKWNWNNNDTLNIFVYTYCDETELFLNNRSLGKKQLDKNSYYIKWTLPYKPGSLKAVGYRNKKKVSEHILNTTSEACQISAKPDKSILKADGTDISFIVISVLDKKNNLVIDAGNEITVNVTGEGKLIGVDSGDLNYEGLFKTRTRKVYKGKILVTIQSTNKPGRITVDISSENIKSLPIQLQTVR